MRKLNKKMIIIVCILLIMLNIIFVTKVFSKNICEVNFTEGNSNPKRESEFEVVVSVKNITEPIVGAFFTLDYDTTKLELQGVAEALNSWNLTEIEHTYYIYTPSYEETNLSQDICKLKFKIKADADLGDTTISFSLTVLFSFKSLFFPQIT